MAVALWLLLGSDLDSNSEELALVQLFKSGLRGLLGNKYEGLMSEASTSGKVNSGEESEARNGGGSRSSVQFTVVCDGE